jgi:hypothetical protein
LKKENQELIVGCLPYINVSWGTLYPDRHTDTEKGTDTMNQLAMAIRNISNGGKDLERFNLTTSELIALKSIGNLIGLSSTDMDTYLQNNGDPTEWLINPLVHNSPKAVD